VEFKKNIQTHGFSELYTLEVDICVSSLLVHYKYCSITGYTACKQDIDKTGGKNRIVTAFKHFPHKYTLLMRLSEIGHRQEVFECGDDCIFAGRRAVYK